jgi:hypothetical protein
MIKLMCPSTTPSQNIRITFTQARGNRKTIGILLPEFLGRSVVKSVDCCVFGNAFNYSLDYHGSVDR